MPGTGSKFFNCVLCGKRTKPKDRRSVGSSVKKYLQNSFLITATDSDIICGKCRTNFYLRDKRNSSSAPPPPPPPQEPLQSRTLKSPPSICLSIKSVTKSHARCSVCKKPGPKLVVVQAPVRIATFIAHNIIISAGSRCCPSHLDTHSFKADVLGNVATVNQTFINRSSIIDMLSALRRFCKSNTGLSFETLKDDDHLNLTCLNEANFKEICSLMAEKMRNTPVLNRCFFSSN